MLIKQHLNIFQMCSLTFELLTFQQGEGDAINKAGRGVGETLLRYQRTVFLHQESEPRHKRALFPMKRVSRSIFIMSSRLYLRHKPQTSRMGTAVLTNTGEALGKKGWACRNKNLFLELPWSHLAVMASWQEVGGRETKRLCKC